MQTFSIDGQICTKSEASISVLDHGLLYGDGVFEGLRFYNQKVFEADSHLERLEASAQAIMLNIPMNKTELNDAIKAAVGESGMQDGYIRLVVTRGEGPLGINPTACSAPRVIIIVDELSMVSAAVREQGAKLIIASTRRLKPDQLDPRIKSLNYLNQVLARLEANAAGADEAILLNDQGRVAEGTADNLFIVKQGELMTPALYEGALNGITRAFVIQCAIELHIPVVEKPLSPFDLYTADECFLTGTGAELIPVREVSGRQIAVVRGATFNQIQAKFNAACNGALDS